MNDLPFTEEALHDAAADVLISHGIRPFSKALAHDLYAALAAEATPEPSAREGAIPRIAVQHPEAWSAGYRAGRADAAPLRVLRAKVERLQGWDSGTIARDCVRRSEVLSLLDAAPSTPEPSGEDVERLRQQNHDAAVRHDREVAELRSKVARYENAFQRATELVRGSPVDWTDDPPSKEPDGWWRYTSQQNREVIAAAVLRAAPSTPEPSGPYVKDEGYWAGYRAAQAERVAPSTSQEALRRLLWLNHGHRESLYGDDGEMQCQACIPFWPNTANVADVADYRRAPLADVIRAAVDAESGFRACPLCHDPERVEDMVGGVCLTCADAIAWSQNARRASIVVPDVSADDT